MTLDIVWIDAQIARLQDLRRIATDPEMLKLMQLAQATGTNGALSSTVAVGDKNPVTDNAGDNQAPLKAKRGELTKSVRVAALKQQTWFTGYELKDGMESDGFRFGSANPSISVIDVLRKMAGEGLLNVQEGSGSAPHKYRPKHIV